MDSKIQEKKMRIIHISAKPPYPVVDGGCFASSRLLEDLSNTGSELIHVTLYTEKHPFDRSAYPEKYKSLHAFKADTSITVPGALKSFVSGTSYNIDRFRCEAFQNFLKNEVRDEDLIIIDGLYASTFIDKTWTKKSKLVLREHNVEYKIWEDLSEGKKDYNPFTKTISTSKGNWFKRTYLKYLSKQLKTYETFIANKVDQIWSISDEDHLPLKELCSTPVNTITVSVQSASNSHDYSKNSVFHLGGTDWEPNKESISILLDIWKNELKNEAVELHLIGKGIEHQTQKNIHTYGFVEDLEAVLEKQGILVAPIISGSGIRIKILEALALGIPVITTSKGAQGINSKEALILVSNRAELIEKINELTSNQNLREQIGKKGQEYIAAHHAEDKVISSILNSLGKLKTN